MTDNTINGAITHLNTLANVKNEKIQSTKNEKFTYLKYDINSDKFSYVTAKNRDDALERSLYAVSAYLKNHDTNEAADKEKFNTAFRSVSDIHQKLTGRVSAIKDKGLLRRMLGPSTKKINSALQNLNDALTHQGFSKGEQNFINAQKIQNKQALENKTHRDAQFHDDVSAWLAPIEANIASGNTDAWSQKLNEKTADTIIKALETHYGKGSNRLAPVNSAKSQGINANFVSAVRRAANLPPPSQNKTTSSENSPPIPTTRPPQDPQQPKPPPPRN